ncbi:ergothioneine biosynthesis protein EgtC [Rhodococcus sp. WMMA185]|uniref:ergothioneine biosynthesis protein EgtC n=1 Tax=Rhodococcus sp. WMMA185 TaxID=679318 RepID=UPI000878DB88|nr:ergothioneine biosynthesis protein EgtC [Rhodococcus sp. WMMA185]AOW91864.1 ergothioneine biosynthesis protein EgtC [Rhodococcus sp. WMMA185]
MCRHLGYLGPDQSVGDLLVQGENSLLNQSFAPRDMRGGGTINADGFGVGWWGADGFSRYRSDQPLWSDPALQETLPSIHSGAVVAAARSATVGMPVQRTACAPFSDDEWAFSHNGVVTRWPESLGELAADLPSTDLLQLEAPTDSAALWLLLRRLLGEYDPEKALATLVTAVIAAAPQSRLNLLLGNGQELWATTWYHSLSAFVDDERAIVSSEPYDDDPNWQAIPDRHLVVARPGHLIVTPLEIGAS